MTTISLKAALGLVAGASATLFIGYCIYFDRKRRSDPDFKKKLRERKYVAEKEDMLLQEKPCKFKCRIKTFIAYPTSKSNLEDFLKTLHPEIVQVLKENLDKLGCLKVYILVEVEYLNKDEAVTVNLKTKNREVYKSSNLGKFVDGEFHKIIGEMVEYQLKGSGHTFSSAVKLELCLNRHCVY